MDSKDLATLALILSVAALILSIARVIAVL